jgi:hypothetical protein
MYIIPQNRKKSTLFIQFAKSFQKNLLKAFQNFSVLFLFLYYTAQTAILDITETLKIRLSKLFGFILVFSE